MKLFILFFALTTRAQACPLSFEYRGEKVCAELQWQKADTFKAGIYTPTINDSPYLNAMDANPSQWLYSRARVKVWLKADAQQTSVEVAGLQFLPYMIMKNGHDHKWGFQLSFNKQNAVYDFYGMPFQYMEGCWQIRWKDLSKPEETSLLIDNLKFSNSQTQQSCN